jgi:hypothetical protein
MVVQHTYVPGCSFLSDPGFNAIALLRQEMVARGAVSQKPLIVNPAEGATGTTTFMVILKDVFGIPTHRVLSDWDDETGRLSPANYSKFNWARQLANYDAVRDTPSGQLFPYIILTTYY